MRKICVATVSRADYGLLRWVAKEIDDSAQLELQILATGSHFSEVHGNTIEEIKNDGFRTSAEVPIAPRRTDALGVTEALGGGLGDVGKVLGELSPDCVVLLGDRAETLAVAIASTLAAIPIAHIHGGEITSGAIDDAFRHSITKMSHLHFVAHETYRRRVIQLGELASSVYVVGPLGGESIVRREFMPREDLENQLGVSFGAKNLLLTIHPETLYPNETVGLVDSLLSSLGRIGEAHLFFTAANTDVGGDEINQRIRDYCAHHEHAWYFESLGADRYLSLMNQVEAVVGNSSSGFFEAPTLGVPTVDIGRRQDGRIAASSVQRVPADSEKIAAAIRAIFENQAPYFVGGARNVENSVLPSRVITQVLETADLHALREKKFVDVEPSQPFFES